MKLNVQTGESYKLRVAGQENVPARVSTPISVQLVNADPYEGEYTVAPTTEAQILETRNLRMTDNVTIEPIPSNYGLIVWNGSVLTVS